MFPRLLIFYPEAGGLYSYETEVNRYQTTRYYTPDDND
jgi:hypothetical protein